MDPDGKILESPCAGSVIDKNHEPDLEDTMSQPIIHYIVFDYVNFVKAKDAVKRIVGFTLRPEGRAYLRNDPTKRAVIHVQAPMTLYLSPGALEIARTLRIDLPASKVVHGSDLPRGLTLLIGEPGDLSK